MHGVKLYVIARHGIKYSSTYHAVCIIQNVLPILIAKYFFFTSRYVLTQHAFYGHFQDDIGARAK